MPAVTTNLEPLGRLVGPDQLQTSPAATERFRVDGVTPAAVVEPANSKELAEIVAWARSNRAALLPATSGIYLPLGNPPTGIDVAVSLARLNRVLHYDPGDLTLSVEPGILLAHVQELLAERGLFLPVDPPYADRAAVGGLVATNASGPLRYAYGTWRDFVVGMKCITGEGKPVKTGGRVVKNVAGYDLSKLMIGSLGTLALLTEINFKVCPRPPHTATFVAGFADADAALEMRSHIVHSVWQPRALELLDPAAGELLQSAPVAAGAWTLLVSVGGVETVITRYENDFSELAGELTAKSFSTLREEDERALWSAACNLVGLVREAHPNATIIKVALPITHIGAFLHRAREVAARYDLPAAASAHAGSGIAYIYLLPADGSLGVGGHPSDMAEAPARMAQAATEMIHAGNNLAGRVTIPWCPTAVKRDVNVWGPLRDDFPLMQKLKAQFDPDRVLNPGRFLGGL